MVRSLSILAIDSRFYKDLCAPTITLAVGLNSWVVLQPVADSTSVATSKAALMLIAFLPYVLSVLDSDGIDNS